MDRIRLDGIRAYGRHGVDSTERERAQPFDVAICAELDLADAAVTDDLSRTLNYAALHERVVRIVATTSYALLERLAADVLDAVLEDRRVVRAQVTIGKPGILDGATPSVTLSRSR
jgi:7,8-dihydroneopterin aldolase/epimerase/oxygenase